MKNVLFKNNNISHYILKEIMKVYNLIMITMSINISTRVYYYYNTHDYDL